MILTDWNEILKDEQKKEYFKEMMIFLEEEYEKKEIFPPKKDIFNAFNLTSYENTRVVILGQDPYINKNQAHGLAFSVNQDEKLPPSLKNIYKEIEEEFSIKMSNSGNLENWAKQGVLLLNAVLTVESGLSNSHCKIGWQDFTDVVIQKLNEKNEPVIFVFWGNFAKQKKKLIKNPKHLVLESSHPSPLSARHSFFNSNHFLKINEFLKKNNFNEIDFVI